MCIQVKKQQLELEMKQQTGSKSGKEYVKTVYYHPAYLTYVWNTSCEGFPHSSVHKESACNAGELGSIPRLGRSPEEEMAIHSSILAWKIPWTEEPGRLQSMGSQESDTTYQLNHIMWKAGMDEAQSWNQDCWEKYQ